MTTAKIASRAESAYMRHAGCLIAALHSVQLRDKAISLAYTSARGPLLRLLRCSVFVPMLVLYAVLPLPWPHFPE